MHHVLRIAVAALLASLVLARPAVAGETIEERQARAEEQRADVRTELGQTRAEIEALERSRAETVAELERVQRARDEAETELERLNAALADARQALDTAIRELRDTEDELAHTEQELDETRRQLEVSRQSRSLRARDAYKDGPSGGIDLILEVRDVTDLGRSLGYLRRVMDDDRRAVALVSQLERFEAQTVDHLRDVRARQVVAERRAEERRAAAAALVQEQERARERLVAQEAQYAQALAAIEQDRDAAAALVSKLEAEDAELQRQLEKLAAEAEAERRAEEARRRAEEAARREAEKAARREAERARKAEAERARRAAAERAARAPDRAAAAASDRGGRLARPTAGPVTSNFGMRHHPILGIDRLHAGMDFGGGAGAPVYAADAGVVVSASHSGGYGNRTVIDHGGGVATVYAHQSVMVVGSGQRVQRGQLIGRIGSTGLSTGPHLHFEVRKGGAPVNPRPWL